MSAKELKRPLRLLLATFFITLIALAGTASKNHDFVDALWVAESGRALKIARADGTVLFEIPDAGGLTSLAIDASHATLWAYGRDPATVAPDLSSSGITPLADATAFLYSGADPIQTGVAEAPSNPRARPSSVGRCSAATTRRCPACR